MEMNIETIFEAKSHAVQSIFSSDLVYYIPEYQRNYSWEEDKLKKLFNDICHGYNLVQKDSGKATFIGSFILIKTDRYKYGQYLVSIGKIGNKPPKEILTIIDGQQRLTSLLLLLSVLHERLIALFGSYKFSEDQSSLLLKYKILEALDDLKKIFSALATGTRGDNDADWYPRLTRANIDAWSVDSPKYDSPIASYLYEYGKIARESYDLVSKGIENEPDPANKKLHELWDYLRTQKVEEPFEPFNEPAKTEENEKFTQAIKIFRDLLTTFCQLTLGVSGSEESDEELPEVPAIDRVFEEVTWENYRFLLSNIIDADLNNIKKVDQNLTGNSKTTFQLLTQLTLFTRFVLNNVAVTIITAQNEDYAFDIFESLNTTGEPLTAVETFKPKVLQLSDSDSRCYIQTIDTELNKRVSAKKTDEKRTNTENLMITFSLEEKGEKLSKLLNSQRAFLKLFDQFTDNNEKALFVKNLFISFYFQKNVWEPKVRYGTSKKLGIPKVSIPNTFDPPTICDEEAHFCLDFLNKLNHTLVQPVLIRYYSVAFSDEEKISDFEKIVKACAAFSLIRRAFTGKTEGIDQVYRKLMKGEIGKRKQICRLDEDNIEVPLPTVEEVQGYLRDFLLEKGIDSKKVWIEKVIEQPLFKLSKQVAKFLLIAAFDKDDFDKNDPLVMKSGDREFHNLIKRQTWKDDKVETLEHVVPQSRSHWKDSKYDRFYSGANKNNDNPLMHGIGNLVICSKKLNQSFGNREWSVKKKAYEICSAETKKDATKLAKDYEKELTRKSRSLYKEEYSRFLRHLAYLEEDDLNETFIMERAKQIAGLAWDRVIPWLGIEAEEEEEDETPSQES